MQMLVTGGSGFLGAGLVRELVAQGHAVRVAGHAVHVEERHQFRVHVDRARRRRLPQRVDQVGQRHGGFRRRPGHGGLGARVAGQEQGEDDG